MIAAVAAMANTLPIAWRLVEWAAGFCCPVADEAGVADARSAFSDMMGCEQFLIGLGLKVIVQKQRLRCQPAEHQDAVLMER